MPWLSHDFRDSEFTSEAQAEVLCGRVRWRPRQFTTQEGATVRWWPYREALFPRGEGEYSLLPIIPIEYSLWCHLLYTNFYLCVRKFQEIHKNIFLPRTSPLCSWYLYRLKLRHKRVYHWGGFLQMKSTQLRHRILWIH